MQYILTIILINGEQRELLLDEPHEIVPANNEPKALAWRDRDNILHNVPWTSILEFYFSPDEYNACRVAWMNKNKKKETVNG